MNTVIITLIFYFCYLLNNKYNLIRNKIIKLIIFFLLNYNKKEIIFILIIKLNKKH